MSIQFPNSRILVTGTNNPLFITDIINANESVLNAMKTLVNLPSSGSAAFAIISGFTYYMSEYGSGICYMNGNFYYWAGSGLIAGKYLKPNNQTAYNVKFADDNYYDSYLLYECELSNVQVDDMPVFDALGMNQYRLGLSDLQTLANQKVQRHLTGTTTTRPGQTGWSLDLSKVGPTSPTGIREIYLWKYQLPDGCHIMRIRPNQQSWFGFGSAFLPNIVPANGDRATLYKILPHSNIYDGYELIIQVDCSDTSPVSQKSRYFSILGQYTVVADAVNYLGNIVLSTQKEEVLKVTTANEFVYGNKIANGADSLVGQMINISSGDINAAVTVSTNANFTQYCLNMLYIKLKWNSARNLWEQIGLSQPYVS